MRELHITLRNAIIFSALPVAPPSNTDYRGFPSTARHTATLPAPTASPRVGCGVPAVPERHAPAPCTCGRAVPADGAAGKSPSISVTSRTPVALPSYGHQAAQIPPSTVAALPARVGGNTPDVPRGRGIRGSGRGSGDAWASDSSYNKTGRRSIVTANASRPDIVYAAATSILDSRAARQPPQILQTGMLKTCLFNGKAVG